MARDSTEAKMSNRLGEYLRSLRQAKGLTTRQLSQVAQCSHSFITLIETGERAPSLGRLWQLVQVLDGDLNEAIFYLCLDVGIPEDVARNVIPKP